TLAFAPVLSAQIPCLQGILQGISAKLPLRGDFWVEFPFSFPCLARQIPYSAEQGIFEGQQGISHADQGKYEASLRCASRRDFALRSGREIGSRSRRIRDELEHPVLDGSYERAVLGRGLALDLDPFRIPEEGVPGRGLRHFVWPGEEIDEL